MTNTQFRDMLPRERHLVDKLLATSFPGRDELVVQLRTAEVRTIDFNGSFEFRSSATIEATHVKYAVPVECEYNDCDGSRVHILLHMDGAQAKEVEFYREGGATVLSWPELTNIEVFAPT